MTNTFAHDLLQPKGWKPAKGYANGVAATGQLLFLGGQIGWNGQQEFESDDFIDQLKQTLANICAILSEAGAGPEHLVRLTWFVVDKADYAEHLAQIGSVYREYFGRNFPAMTLVEVKSLLEPRARLEIEATAVLPAQA